MESIKLPIREKLTLKHILKGKGPYALHEPKITIPKEYSKTEHNGRECMWK